MQRQVLLPITRSSVHALSRLALQSVVPYFLPYLGDVDEAQAHASPQRASWTPPPTAPSAVIVV